MPATAGAQTWDATLNNGAGGFKAFTPTTSGVTQPNGGATANADPSKAGQPGYDVFGNVAKSAQLPGSPPAMQTPAQQAKPQTAFSSDQGAQHASDNTQTLQTLKNTGLTVGQDGLARFSDASFATAPSDAVQNEDGTWQSGGVKYALGPATSVDPELQKINDQITQMKTQFDTTSRAAIDNIKAQFDNLIKQQGDINTRQTASLDQSLLMGGSSRYAQESSSGQHSAIMSYGLGQLADLNQKEQSAVIQAQQAMDSGDMKLMDEQITIAQKARDDKQAAAKTLSDKLTAANDKIVAAKKQQGIDTAIGSQLSSGVTDVASIVKALADQGIAVSAKDVGDSIANLNPNAKEIATGLQDMAKNGASPDAIAQAAKSTNLAQFYQQAGKYLTDPTSNVGMYNAYVARTTAAGQTPVSAEKFLSMQDYNKAYNTSLGTEAGKAAGAPAGSGSYNLSALSPAAQIALQTNGFVKYNPSTQSLASDLVEGRMAPSELSKRTTGTSSYNDILTAAKLYSQATKGQSFDISKADINYKFATNKNTQDTLNYLGSLVGTDDGSGNLKGGNLDELVALNKQVSEPSAFFGFGKGNFPALNDATNWARLATGDPKMAAYQAVATEVADQVAKILQGGGSGGTSDAKLQQAANLFNSGFSKDQLEAVVSSLKPLLTNRASSMVKDNPYLSDYSHQFGLDKTSQALHQATQDETDATTAIQTYDSQSSENQQRVDDLRTKFPNASATEIKAALGI